MLKIGAGLTLGALLTLAAILMIPQAELPCTAEVTIPVGTPASSLRRTKSGTLRRPIEPRQETVELYGLGTFKQSNFICRVNLTTPF